MTVIDSQSLLAPISQEDPSGPDLEYDADFIQLEQSARIEPEQQFGSTIIPAREPEWSVVQKEAENILKRSKDLRVSVHLIQSLTYRFGFSGLRDGIVYFRELIENFWETIHPKLDPDDDHDPTIRMNIISGLCAQDFVVYLAKSVPLFYSKVVGKVSLRDLQIARGQISVPKTPESQLVKYEVIQSAATDLPPGQLSELLDQIKATEAALVEIEAFLTDQVGVSNAISFDPLTGPLHEISLWLIDIIGVGKQHPHDQIYINEAEPDSLANLSNSGGRRICGEINGRDDVITAIDLIIAYYQRCEPGSPIPLLLMRAKKLINLGFLDILADIAPDAVTQASRITGGAITSK